MTAYSRRWAAMACPWRWFGLSALAAVLLCWTATGWTLTPAPGTPVVNRATVQYGDVNGNSLPAVSAGASVPLSGAPLFHLEKTADSDPVVAGATFSYTLRYENTGNASATGVRVVDTLPATVTFQTASAGGVYNPADRTVIWTIGTLASGNGGYLTVTVKVASGLTVGTPIVNTAAMTSTEGVQGTAALTTTVGAGANLVLTKSGAPAMVTPNGVITYNLSYRNIGNVDARQVRITDQIPAGTAYVAGSATPVANFANNALTWNLGDVAAGSQGTAGFQVRVSSLAVTGQQISNTAGIISADQNRTSNTVVSVVSARSLLLLKMDTPDPVRAGLNITYTLQVENTGAVPLTGVVLNDPLPVGTTFVSADSGGVAAAGGRQVDWTVGNLAVGQKQTVRLVVRVDSALAQGGLIENIATATTNETPPQTVKAVSSINARTAGQVEFYNAAWQAAYGFISGDTIYLQVKDADQNVDPTVAETVTVVLTDLKTGDTENVVLTETGPNTGIFRGSMASTLTATTNNSGALTVASNSRIRATYTDSLDAAPVSTASALIDPLGVVFDSVTGKPVAGVVVTLRNWDGVTNTCDLTSWPVLPPGQVNPAVPTVADGKFAFPLVPPGDFCFDVKPATGYTYPSVVPDASLPAGFTIGNGSRGEKFTLSAGDPPLIRDIPVDPPAGRLTITKTANKTAATIGEMIIYSVTLANDGAAPVTNLTVTDVMPHGIQYLPGSSRINGNALADPQLTGSRTFTWTVSSLAASQSLEISYRSVVGPDSQMGTGINTVSAAGTSLGKTVASNTAYVKVKITEGVFTTKGTIIGRVFIDRDGDGIPKKDSGVPEAVLYLEDGTRVVTDKMGKFSIPGIVAGTHVLRLDETSLPEDVTPVPLSNRFMLNGLSQFIDMTPGGLFKANFAVEKKKGEAKIAPAVPSPQPGRQPDEKAPAKTPAQLPGKPPVKEEGTSSPVVQPEKAIPEAPEGASEKAATPSLQTSDGGSAGQVPPVSAQGEASGPVPTVIGRDARVSEITPAAGEPGKIDSAAGESSPTKTEPDLPAKPAEAPLEEQILKMTPDLDILSPGDQAVSARNNIRVLVKTPADTVLTLSVNGEMVDDRHIGKTVRHAKGQVVVYEFVDIRLKPGEENLIMAEVRDPFGIVRGMKKIRVAAVGEPVRIVIRTDQAEAAADGKSRTGVTVSLQDRKGNPVSNTTAVTVAVTAGEILEKDADPSRDGHQILCRDGVARFTIVSPRETGEAKIHVQVNDLNESADIYFVPHLRQMLLVGLGEIILGHGRSSGDLNYLKQRAWFDDGPYLNGRGAFFLKGNVYKDFLLTAAYDSNKKQPDELFRESDTRLDSEDKYPIYGDESKVGYEALSRDRLYVKLEKGKSYLLYGDYRTDLTETKLSAYTRSFNGLKLDVNTDRLKLRSFGSYTDQSQFVDTVPGKGISGYYYLTRRQIIEGSERVVIETRDRLQPDRVLNRENKARGSDYDIDYDLGTLLFKAPVPSRDADGNPLYIVATYESRQEGNKFYIYGGRGAYKPASWLEVGATGIVEENAISNYTLYGSDVTLKLPGKTTLKAEYANTRGLFDINSTYLPRNGDGWSVDVESRPLDRLALTGYYRTLSEYFVNPSATDAVRGTRKYGFDATYAVRPDLTLKAKYLDEDDSLNHSTHRLASVGATQKFTKTTLSADVSHETSENLTPTPTQTPFTPGGLLNGVPFINAYETPKRATFAKLALERELLRDLTLSLSHKHDLGGDGLYVSQGGLNYQLNKLNRLYLREEYAKYQENTQTRTLLGMESQVVKDTTAYQEFRLADGSAGYRNQQVMGLKNKFKFMDGATGNLAAEYLSTLNGRNNPNEPDALAVAGGLEYLPKDNLKLTSRAEHRHEIVNNGTDSYLAEVAAAYKLHPDYSLLLRERYFLESKGGVGENHTSRLMAGLAYRPLENDRLNALGKLEYKYDRRMTAQPTYTADSFILSTEGIYQLTRKMQLMGKYAAKLEKEDVYSSYTDLIAARIMYDLTDRFDFGVEYRMLTSYRISTRLHGGAVEVGYRIFDQLWLSLGYSFDKFDADLAGDSYQGEGPYLKLRFKFDETTLRNMMKSKKNGDTLTRVQQ